MDYGRVCDWDAVGQGAMECQHPPEIGPEDMMAWTFYKRRATAFARDFGLMAGFVEKLGLDDGEMDVLMARLGAIHAMYVEMAERDSVRSGG